MNVKAKLSFEKIHQRALMRIAAPSVVVDYDSNVVHISADACKYLRHVSGEPSRNLPAIVLPELRLELLAALFQAIQSGKPAKSPSLTCIRPPLRQGVLLKCVERKTAGVKSCALVPWKLHWVRKNYVAEPLLSS